MHLTEGEQSLADWKCLFRKDDTTMVWDLIGTADDRELSILRKKYPTHVAAWERYQQDPTWIHQYTRINTSIYLEYQNEIIKRTFTTDRI